MAHAPIDPSADPLRPAGLPVRLSKIAPLLRPLHAFLASESAGGILLMVAAVIALAWANSPWGDSYTHFWHTKAFVGFGDARFGLSLEHWVNDGLMVVFFLLVGLEIKRELLVGELASVRRAALPVAAAVGGMVVPALIYAAVNFGGNGAHGWGVPMATDIAFAVGVLALVGRGVPSSVKVFLLAIAIVDDLGAILVIAVFYTGHVSLVALTVAGVFLLGLIGLNVLRVHKPLPYLLLGVCLWAATLASGIHATVSGVLLAFTLPASRPIEEASFVDYVRKMLARFDRDAAAVPDRLTGEQAYALQAIGLAAEGVQTPMARVEHALLWPVNYLIVPLFALANAGVDLRDGIGPTLGDAVAWGVLLGLVVGKPLGVLLFSFVAVRTNLAAWPDASRARQIVGVSVLCGIGFTMSLFVANLAFPGHAEHLAAAKVGVLAASLVAGVGGAILLTGGRTPVPSPGTPREG